MSKAAGRKPKDKPKGRSIWDWLGPAVLGIALALVLGFTFYQIAGSDDDEKDAEPSAPELIDYPAAAQALARPELDAAPTPRGMDLRSRHAEWWMSWPQAGGDILNELVLFVSEDYADRYWQVVPEGEDVDGLGIRARHLAGRHEVWIKRGRVIARVSRLTDPDRPAPLDEQWRTIAAELDAAIVRTFGAEP